MSVRERAEIYWDESERQWTAELEGGEKIRDGSKEKVERFLDFLDARQRESGGHR